MAMSWPACISGPLISCGTGNQLVEPLLDGLEDVFVFPAGKPALFARGADHLDGASLASSGPEAAQGQSLVLVCVAVAQARADGTDVCILRLHIAKAFASPSRGDLNLNNEAKHTLILNAKLFGNLRRRTLAMT